MADGLLKQQIAQLEWMISTPELMAFADEFTLPTDQAEEFHDCSQRTLDRLKAGHIAPPSVSPSLRLGFQFEGLLHWLLNHDPNYQIISYNQQIHDQQRTIGAVDFVLRYLPSNEVQHWEAAVKFYLAIDVNGERVYLGANANDSLSRKHQHLCSHQLTLLKQPQAQGLLQQLAIGIDRSVAFSRGMVFYHEHYPPTDHPQLNKQHLHGAWYFAHQAPLNLRYFDKPQWLQATPSLVLDTPPRLPCRAINTQGQHCIVVPDHWPTKKEP
ncbi:DUF1853 family protein [Paraferrimonas haliotis]|uniref:Uncharacterized protein n=1 Tax=Paraferrimonas haliotis TaxID=2013866 RepID=A0AA37WXF7_9GAMM|nr:DUF1853 family protein [Paraferrimonas haliotis]GLS84528.1 hypothetical protein GCM10007894_25050 [Paraferrimonas haliotis]